MPRMLDLIRTSQVPSNLMQSAARGSLAVPADEMVEILVYLAVNHKLFGEQSRLTLAGWDEKSSREVAANPNTSGDVLGYLASSENLRISLLPQLAENPSVSEESLDALAVSGSRPVVEALFTSARVMNSPRLLQALQSNPSLRPNELVEIGKKLAAMETTSESELGADEADASDEVIAGTVTKYLEENAAELAAEKDKPFQPIGMSLDEIAGQAEGEASPAAVADATTAAAEKEVADASAAKAKKAAAAKESRRDSVLQKIAKLDIRGRITLAMRGTKEDRSILIRDSTKLVAIAVLDSPKVSDGEVEKFALQKNVLEAVLRAIPMRRRFAKNYNITRNLVQNPRTPLDLSLGLVKSLLVHDLKNLSGNKEVSDTIRKVALRMFKQKVEKKG
jgi:cellobiose-specific phosphotransferase system component IIB